MLQIAARMMELKRVPRTGWAMRGIAQPESVAEHSWGTALLCALLADAARDELPQLDRARAIEMALIHDLAEVETGDRPHDADPAARRAKAIAEREAMQRLFPGAVFPAAPPQRASTAADESPPAGATPALWQEYEDAASDTARFVRDMNLVEMCLQARCYENRDGRPLTAEFVASSRPRLATRLAARLIDRIERD